MSLLDSTKKCKKEVDALELQVAGNDVVKNAFDNKKWFCHKQTLTPSYQNPDMTNVTAEYKLGNNRVVQIKNCGIRPNGTRECVSFLRGTLAKRETNAKFTVKPWFVPSIFVRNTNYWILDQSDKHMVVSAGNPTIQEDNCVRRPEYGQGLWILTNSKKRDERVIGNALNKIKALGINGKDMVDIVHN